MSRWIALQRRDSRRAAVAAYVLIGLTAIMGFAALAVDVSMLYSAKAELQRAADASSLASAWRMLDENRIKGGATLDGIYALARSDAAALAARNTTLGATGTVDGNQDVTLGHVNYGGNPADVFNNSARTTWNAAYVVSKRDTTHSGSIALFFARALGVSSRDLQTDATAAFWDNIRGFRVTNNSGNAGLLPFALQINVWNSLISGGYASNDHYSYNSDSGTVSSGADGIGELNLYPGAGTGQLSPGNFGTVDIGSPNNSTADLSRQIRYGVNADDLSYFPNGELRLGANGTLSLNGDTGLSAGVKDDLAAIIGKPRTIPLFSTMSGNGNNANYTIVGFGGIRILDVKLTGSMNSKYVMIQPAIVVDATAEGGTGNTSMYVYTKPQLIR